MTGISLSSGSPYSSDQHRRDQVKQTSLSILQQQTDYRVARAVQSLTLARTGGTDPNQIARGSHLASTALNNPQLQIIDPTLIDSLEARVRANRESNILRENPRTAEWASEYNNALAAHDDISHIGAIESLGRAFVKGTDRTVDDFSGGLQIDAAATASTNARDTMKSLEEIMNEERLRTAEGSLKIERAVEAMRAGEAPSETPFAQSEIEARLDEGLGIAGWSSDARGLWRWFTSRLTPMSDDMANDIIERSAARTGAALSEMSFQARDREGFNPTPEWRREFEARYAEVSGETAIDGIVGMFGLLKEDPARGAQWLMEVGAESGAGIAAAMAAGILTRSPAAATAIIGASSYAASATYFNELVDKYGYDLSTEQGRRELVENPDILLELRDKTKAYQFMVGYLDALSGGAATQALAKNPVGDMLLQILTQATLGGSGEFLGRIAANEDIDWKEVIVEALAEAVTAPIEVGGLAITGVRRKVNAIGRSRDNRTLFGLLSGAVEASTLRPRDAAKFENAVKYVTENGPIETVHIDPAQFEELFQSDNLNITLEEFFSNVPGLDIKDFQTALETGSLYTIPTSVYAAYVAGTPLAEVMQDHIKFDPSDLSTFEARTLSQDMLDVQSQLEANSQKLDTIIGQIDGPLAEQLERLTSEIMDTSGWTRTAAEQQAGIFVAAARAGSARAGMTTAEYLRRYVLPAVRNPDLYSPPARGTYDAQAILDLVQADASATPDLTAIADELEKRGTPADVASVEDIRDVIDDLLAAGTINLQPTVEEAAAPNSVEKPDGEEFMQTATLRGGEEDASAWGIDTKARNKVRDIALALEKRQRKLYGKTARTKRDPKTVDKFASWMADEIEFELQTPGAAAAGWYTTKYQKALDKLGELFPELNTGRSNLPGLKKVKTKEDARMIFTAILAITSNGAKVVENFQMAVRAYGEFRATGQLVAPPGGSDRAKHTRTAFARLGQILDEFASPTEAQQFLLEEVTVSEMNKALTDIGLPKVTKLAAATRVPRAAGIFGPKLGAFYANLSGSTGYLTMDLWWTRTINRYRGDVLPRVKGLKGEVNSKGKPVGLNRFKHMIGRPDLTDSQALNYVTEYAQRYADKGYKNGTEAEKAANTIYKDAFVKLAEAPEGAADRTFMIEVAYAARDKVFERTGELYSLADIQALIWYYEKRLYADMGVRDSGDVSYMDAVGLAMNAYTRGKVIDNPPAQMDEEFFQSEIDPLKNSIKEDTLMIDGKPVMFYHGTNRDFTTFKDGRIFLTNKKGLATEHALRQGLKGARVIQANVALANPIEINTGSTEPDAYWLANTMRIEGFLNSGSHDSVILWSDDGEAMVIATRDDQITQVTSGTDTAGMNPPAPSDERIEGLEKASPGRVPGVREAATAYMLKAGLPVRHQATYAPVSPRAKEIAQLYEEMEHNPKDPEVKAAYDALAKEVIAQFNHMVSTLGIDIDWIAGKDPYDTPADAIRDMQENNHLWVFPTDDGFGTINEAGSDNPLLKHTGYYIKGRNARVNDLFRIVHDVFGHGIEGASFGPRGEENAWQAHVRMFSPLAARAMTTETRGQNSWVNFGPHAEHNRTNPHDTIFADQKTGLLPEWVSVDDQVEDLPYVRPDDAPATLADFQVKDIEDLDIKAFERPGWFIVSAKVDSEGDPMSEGNVARANTMRQKLEHVGAQYMELTGTYDGKSDGTSFLVIGEESYGQSLGVYFNQESILTNKGLIYTDGSARPNVPFKGMRTGWDATNAEFYSHINGMAPNANFSLNLIFPQANDQSAKDTDYHTHYGAELVFHPGNISKDRAAGDRPNYIRLVHWSRRSLQEINPIYAGRGPLNGPERHRGGPRKSFFGMHEDKDTGYVRESKSLGRFKHVVYQRFDDLYPWWNDPDNLKAKMPTDLTNDQEIAWYENAIEMAGWRGYFVIGGPLGDVAVMFGAAHVTEVEETNDAANIYSDEFKAFHEGSAVVNPDGTPRLVYHSTHADENFASFRTLSHFGSLRAAEERASPGRTFYGEGARVIPGYLAIKNPLRLVERDGPGGTWGTDYDVLASIPSGLGRAGHNAQDRKFRDLLFGDSGAYTLWDYNAYLAKRLSEALGRPVPYSRDDEQMTGLLEAIMEYGAKTGVFGALVTMDRDGEGEVGLTLPKLIGMRSFRGGDHLFINDYVEDVVYPAFMAIVEEAGYDGFIYENQVEDVGVDSFIVMRPNQFKSAWNSGVWSKDSDMLKQGNRGSIILPADGSQATIQLFDGKANLSTVLHEGGHFFLWQMQRQRADGLEFAARDYDIVRSWWKRNAKAVAEEASRLYGEEIAEAQVLQYLETGSTTLGDVDKVVHTALHEQFARGFERYAMEGKAPSNALRTIFESFAAWLLSIYKSAKSLNVEIDADIRGVFDRLLATDEEIAAGENREEINNLVAETAKEMGISEDSYRRMVLLSNEARDEAKQIARAEIMRAEMRLRSAEYDDRYAEIEAEEREKVNSLPVNRAIQWLGYGRWLGGQAPEEMPLELRLDTDLLVDEYGTDIVKQLPRGRRPVHKLETGLSADEVAGWFGFDSGADMIDAMIKAPKANDEIKARTRARALEELGDIKPNTEEMAEIVNDAFHGEKRGQVIVAEMRALNRLSGGRDRRITTRAMASSIARDVINKLSAREAIQSHRYLTAERKHAEDAARKMAAGDVEGALNSKRKQLIQHALYIESRKANELVEKTERLTARLKKKSTREKLAGDYIGAIDDILETYSFRRISGKAEVRRDRLNAYVARMTQDGRANELSIPDHVLKAAKPIPYKTLSVRRLRGVYDTLVNIEHTARHKQKLLDRKAERELQEIIDELGATMAENVNTPEVNRIATRKDRVMSGVKGYFNLARNADTLLRRFDGWKDRGIFVRMFKDKVDEAGLVAIRMREKATNDIGELFNVYGYREREKMAVRQKVAGYPQAISKWDIISVALNLGNKDNRERLMSRDSKMSLTEAQVKALTDTLEKRDWDFIQSVWDYLDNEYWPLIKAREERVTGVAPEKVEAMQVDTKFGVYRGGYYPIVYDSRFSKTVGDEKAQDLMVQMMAGKFGKAATKNGHTKERASGGGGRTVELGMHVLFGHLNHVIHDLAYGEAVGETWSLLQHKDVKAMFEKHGRLEDHRALEMWIQDVAAGPAAGTHALAGMLRRLKSGFTMSKLAFNMSTVAIQITGVTQSMVQVGTGNVIAGYSQYVGSGFKLANQIAERSTFMKERQKTFQRDVLDMLNDTQLDPMRSRLSDAQWVLMQAGFWAMQKVQYYSVDVPTWLGAHRQGLAQGMTDEEAALHADRMVARAQASGLYADRSAVERGTMGPTSRQNEFIRLFTALGSYLFAKFNVAEEVIGRTANAVRDDGTNSVLAILKGMSDLVMLFTVEMILYNLVKGRLPGMDEDDDEEGWAAFLAKETAFSIMSVFPFIRDLASVFQGFGGGGSYGGIIETVGRSGLSIGKALTGEATGKDARAVNDLGGLMVPGYPSTAMWRVIDGAGLTGEEPSPLAMVLGR